MMSDAWFLVKNKTKKKHNWRKTFISLSGLVCFHCVLSLSQSLARSRSSCSAFNREDGGGGGGGDSDSENYLDSRWDSYVCRLVIIVGVMQRKIPNE